MRLQRLVMKRSLMAELLLPQLYTHTSIHSNCNSLCRFEANNYNSDWEAWFPLSFSDQDAKSKSSYRQDHTAEVNPPGLPVKQYEACTWLLVPKIYGGLEELVRIACISQYHNHFYDTKICFVHLNSICKKLGLSKVQIM